MSFKTLKRRLQRKKSVFAKAERKRMLQSFRDRAFEEWKKKHVPILIKEFRNSYW